MTKEPVIDFLLKRRSVLAAQMAEPSPSEKDLRKILTAAIRVPDHGKLQPWRIQILRKAAQRALGEVFAKVVAAEQVLSEAQFDAARERLCRAPLLLAVSCHPRPDRFSKVPLIEQQMSAAAVCSNILNAAGALGYAAQWLTGPPAYCPEVKQALGLTDDNDIVGFMNLGSIESAPKERPRPDYDDIVSEWHADA